MEDFCGNCHAPLGEKNAAKTDVIYIIDTLDMMNMIDICHHLL